MMKKYFLLLLAMINACLSFAACSSDPVAEVEGQEGNVTASNGKTLVVYYSYTGHIKSVVDALQSQIEADVVEVLPEEEGLKYDADNYAIGSALITAIRNNPTAASSYPGIKTSVSNWSDYSNVIIATPLWWSNMAAIMQSFLFKYGSELAGKNVGLIVSSQDSGISGVESDAKRLVPDAKWFSKSLHVKSAEVSNASSMVSTWLSEIGFSSASQSQAVSKINVKVNGYTLTATLADNTSAQALVELLEKGDVTINAHDYGNFEKVGDLPQSLPQNNTQITTSAGDIILYLGTSICFYYAQNSWNFTRLGRIDNAESLDLKSIYGSGNATFVLSLPTTSGISKTSSVKTSVQHTSVYTADGKLLAQSSVDNLPKGVYVVRQTMSDGTIQSKKIKL